MLRVALRDLGRRCSNVFRLNDAPRLREVIEQLEGRVLLTGAGDLDTTFGGDGEATTSLDQVTLHGNDVAVEADGKVVVAGSATFGTSEQWAVARYNADGTPDGTWGHNGVLLFSSFQGLDPIRATDVVIDHSGRILVGGVMKSGFGWDELFIARYLPNGTLDPSFSGGAVRGFFNEFDTRGAVYSDISDLLIEDDGKIIVTGSCTKFDLDGNDSDFAIKRLNEDGTADKTFGADGDFGSGTRFSFGAFDTVHAAAIDYSGTPATNTHWGSIVMVGETGDDFSLGSEKFAFARITPDGHLDSSFSGDGKLSVPFVGEYNYSVATGVVVQPTGNYVIAGTVGVDRDHTHVGLIRLTEDGSGDPSFGYTNGQTEIHFGHTDEGSGDLIIGHTGKLIVSSSTFETGIACMDTEGKLDPLFSGDGVVVTSVGSSSAATAMGLAPDGKFVVGGDGGFAAARFFDRGATVAVTSVDSIATEAGETQASFFVTRAERLPYPTRVYFTIGGTATLFPLRVLDRPDYTLDGFTDIDPIQAYVDIPADETFAPVFLTAVDDTRVETDETATFTIPENIPGVVDLSTPTSVTLSIRDDDHQIGGSVFNDADASTSFDNNESGLSGWTVYIDANSNNILDAGERTTLSDPTGQYAFGGLAPGSYFIREVRQSGWRQTLPIGSQDPSFAAPSYLVNLATATDQKNNVNFGNTQLVAVYGKVFRDSDGDGVWDANEDPLAGARVYNDTNGNNTLDTDEPFSLSAVTGDYALNLPAGALRIRVAAPVSTSSFVQTLPVSNGSYAITLAAGQTTNNRNFGLKPLTTGRTLTSISGNVFNDLDGDRTRDVQNPVEPDLVGWTVFLDLNKNGKLDAGEPTQVTNDSGNFTFANLTSGVKYRVREVLQAGWVQSTLNPQDITLADGEAATVQFGNRSTAPFLDGGGNLFIYGTGGNDTIRVDVKKGQLRVTVNDVLFNNFSPTGQLVIYALDGKDEVTLTDAVTRDAVIYGGAGADKLTGGSGRNIILGGDDNDVLTGGSQRDLLIGGNGADVLRGGGEDDLLIAGTTVFDDDLSALVSLQQQWSSSDDYGTRSSNVQITLNETTAFDDTAADSASGNAGNDLFYANTDSGGGLVADLLSDKAADEVVVDV